MDTPSDDALLAAVLRRFLVGDDDGPGYFDISSGGMTIDSGVRVSPDEYEALLRASGGHGSDHEARRSQETTT